MYTVVCDATFPVVNTYTKPLTLNSTIQCNITRFLTLMPPMMNTL